MIVPKRFKLEGFGKKFKLFTQEDWEDAIIIRNRIKGGKNDWECIWGECCTVEPGIAPNSSRCLWLAWHYGYRWSGARLKNFSAKEVGIIGYFAPSICITIEHPSYGHLGIPSGAILYKVIFWYDEVNNKKRGRTYMYDEDTGKWELVRNKDFGSGEPNPNTITIWSHSADTCPDCPLVGDHVDDVWIYKCD